MCSSRPDSEESSYRLGNERTELLGVGLHLTDQFHATIDESEDVLDIPVK